MKYLIALVLMSFSVSMQAQIPFERGYFIDNNDVRTDCFIKNLDWRQNPNEFTYKIDPNSDTLLTATIENTKEFAIDNTSKYKRFTTKIERSSTELHRLGKSREPVWNNETLFLKVIVEGDANLYVYNDNAIQKFFYDTNNIPIEQLVHVKYLEYGSNTPGYYSFFRQQLFNNVNCKQDELDFKTLKYASDDLIRHFFNFNQCTGGLAVKFEAKQQNTIAFKIAASADLAKMKIEDPNSSYNVSSEVGKTIFKFGFEIEYYLPFNNNKWSIFVNPMYNRFETKKDFSRSNGVSNGGSIINHTLAANYSSVEVSAGVRYYFLLDNGGKIFISGTAGFDFAMDSDLQFTNDKNHVSDSYYREIHSGYYLAFGAGYNYKKASAELRFNAPREILHANYSEWSGLYSSIGLLLTYQLF